MLDLKTIITYLPIIFLCLIYAFLMSFQPLPPSSKNYSFIDYLLEYAGGLYGARMWGWFLLPLSYLLIGGDLLRNVSEMPPVGWLLIAASEGIIYLLLYWRYKERKKRKK